MTTPDTGIVNLPYDGTRRLKGTGIWTFDSTTSFLLGLQNFVNLPKSESPERTGGKFKLTHDSQLDKKYYDEIYLFLVHAGFSPSTGTYSEEHLREPYLRLQLLEDLVILPGTDKDGQVIPASDMLYEYFWCKTFTAPYQNR